jgi:hypothetical protein
MLHTSGLSSVFNVLPDDETAIAIATSSDPHGHYLRGSNADSFPDGNWASARVYLSDQHGAEAVEAALLDVLEAFDLDVMLQSDPVIESWFRETLLHIRSSGRMREQLAKLERAVDMQTHLRPQAEIDASQGEAVSKLITALEKTPNAIVQIGSVLLVKVGDNLAVRNLTQRELALYERRPELFRDPATALAKIQAFIQADADAQADAGTVPLMPDSVAESEQPVPIDGH